MLECGHPPGVGRRCAPALQASSLPLVPEIGPPLTPHATRLVLLGSGELGREVAIEAMRLGCEVVAVDRYPGRRRCRWRTASTPVR